MNRSFAPRARRAMRARRIAPRHRRVRRRHHSIAKTRWWIGIALVLACAFFVPALVWFPAVACLALVSVQSRLTATSALLAWTGLIVGLACFFYGAYP